jgi:predicted dehydrogenase
MERDSGDFIYGTAGQVVLGADTLRVYTTLEVDGLPRDEWYEIGKVHPLLESRIWVMDGFGAAVLEGRPLPVSGEDGRAALEIALSAYQAGARGYPVELGKGQAR